MQFSMSSHPTVTMSISFLLALYASLISSTSAFSKYFSPFSKSLTLPLTKSRVVQVCRQVKCSPRIPSPSPTFCIKTNSLATLLGCKKIYISVWAMLMKLPIHKWQKPSLLCESPTRVRSPTLRRSNPPPRLSSPQFITRESLVDDLCIDIWTSVMMICLTNQITETLENVENDTTKDGLIF